MVECAIIVEGDDRTYHASFEELPAPGVSVRLQNGREVVVSEVTAGGASDAQPAIIVKATELFSRPTC